MTPAYSTHLHNGTLQWNYPLEQTHLNPVYISGGAAPYTEFESLNGDKVTNGKKQIVIVCEGKNTGLSFVHFRPNIIFIIDDENHKGKGYFE